MLKAALISVAKLNKQNSPRPFGPRTEGWWVSFWSRADTAVAGSILALVQVGACRRPPIDVSL